MQSFHWFILYQHVGGSDRCSHLCGWVMSDGKPEQYTHTPLYLCWAERLITLSPVMWQTQNRFISASLCLQAVLPWGKTASGLFKQNCSPQGEGPLLVSAQPAAVDGGGAGHRVQVVRTVGQRGNPLTVPLRLLFPGDGPKQRAKDAFTLICSPLKP